MTGIYGFDTEYGFVGGVEMPSTFVPVVACFVDAVTGQLVAFWGHDPRLATWLCDHQDDLFLSHGLTAEARYLLNLGVKPPTRWWDSMFAFRYVTNGEFVKPYNLLASCAELKLPVTVSKPEKEQLQEWIATLQFDPDCPDDRRTIQTYCQSDCTCSVNLYRRLAKEVPADWMAYMVEFALATAKAELRGIPWDLRRYTRLQEQKIKVLDHVVGVTNRVCPVFTDYRLNERRFLNWCASERIGWPKTFCRRTRTKRLSFDKDAFKLMSPRHPFIANVYETGKTTKHLQDRDLAVDYGCGRHFSTNICCAQKTSRTSLIASVYAAPKWERMFIRPSSRDHVILHVDLVAEEILLAAYLAQDLAMLEAYSSSDFHLATAILLGKAPPGASPDDPRYAPARKLSKALNLGINYGQGVGGIAGSTGLLFHQAESLLAQHKRLYPAFWAWKKRYVFDAFHRGRCQTVLGWPRKVARHDNPRSVANHPVQGTGADLMRLAVIYLTRNRTPLLAAIHDGFLFEVHKSELTRTREAIDAAFRQAVQQLLPGAPMKWKTEEFHRRYEDKDGKPLWDLIADVLS
jgi:DNA polymerase I-like protein with 3'-5' exonuclease and polymerase domains